MKKLTTFISAIGISLVPYLVSAQTSLPSSPITDYSSFSGFVQKGLGWMFSILLILSVVFVLIGAFNYVTGGGDEKKVAAAKNYIIWAAVGIAVALVAKGISTLVGSFFGVTVQPF